MKREAPNRRITFSEIGNALSSGLGAIDADRARELNGLARLRGIKDAQLEREQTRLTERYGENDARVQALAARRAVNTLLIADIEHAARRAQMPAPAPDANAWIVHGHVFGPDGSVQADRVLTLHDADGKQLLDQQARSDDSGHFILCVTAQTLKDPETGATRAAGMRFDNAAGAANTLGVYLHVSDIAGKTLHRDMRELQPARGQVDYREIILRDDPCGQRPPRGKPDTGGSRGDGGDKKETPRGPEADRTPTQPFVGNPATRELHDTQKITKRCKLDAIKPDARVYFANTADAEKAGYDYCAFCFGKDKSRR